MIWRPKPWRQLSDLRGSRACRGEGVVLWEMVSQGEELQGNGAARGGAAKPRELRLKVRARWGSGAWGCGGNGVVRAGAARHGASRPTVWRGAGGSPGARPPVPMASGKGWGKAREPLGLWRGDARVAHVQGLRGVGVVAG